VSEQAVKKQISALFRRFAVTSRTGLVTALFEDELGTKRAATSPDEREEIEELHQPHELP